VDKTFSEVFDHIEAALDCEFNVTLYPEENGVLVRGVKALQAQRDRALEAVGKLREALIDRATYSFYYDRDVPHQSQHEHCRCRKCTDSRVKEALAVTEPATVELPKCDHCDAIGCGTDCDGSSHYTPEKKGVTLSKTKIFIIGYVVGIIVSTLIDLFLR
jgi:hypothetical protein